MCPAGGQNVRRSEFPDTDASVFARLALAGFVLEHSATMTAPRAVFPDSFVLITRRCTQRQFLLRPDDETNNAYTYCLAEAAKRFGMELILSEMMSNHHHTVLYDRLGLEPQFREHFHKMLAKCMNALRGRWENLWSTEESCVVELFAASDLVDKLVYVATNPVLDHLVEKVHHWPGPKLLQCFLSGEPLKAHRPRHYFHDEGTMPEEVELVLALPANLPDRDAILAAIRRRIPEVEAQCAAQRIASGRGIVGRRRILRQSWRDSPTSREPRRNLRPRVAARSKWLRIAALQRNREWQAEYQLARKQWLAGFTDVEFPAGTYWLKRFANVRVREAVGKRPSPLTDSFTDN